MAVMFAMTVLGRGIGFVRGMAFCRLMDDTEVGQWSMAFGFITLITPVMLLGIPGALPRFTETYRLRGELATFVRRIALGTAGCTAMFLVVLMLAPEWFGWIVFLQPERLDLIHAVAAAVVGMITYNFVSDLCGSLRLVRVVSMMQFLQGVGFTCLSVTWLFCNGGLIGVVWMFTLACWISAVTGSLLLRRFWSTVQQVSPQEVEVSRATGGTESSLRGMICRLAPYAGALWLMNLVGNCFELSDRYMILHFMPTASDLSGVASELTGQAAVGQYHAGRIIPMLLLSLAMMISGILLPYLAADWEQRRVEKVQQRVRDVLTLVSLSFTAGSSVAILAGPWVFEVLLQGRYAQGLGLMPMALCFCTWSAMVTIGQTYLWTVERGKWVPLAMFAGLVSNLLLNALLLPRIGLDGAVIATLCSHGVVMVGVWIAMYKCGYRSGASWVLISLLPLTLLASPIASMGLAFLVAWTQWQHPPTRQRWLESLPSRIRWDAAS